MPTHPQEHAAPRRATRRRVLLGGLGAAGAAGASGLTTSCSPARDTGGSATGSGSSAAPVVPTGEAVDADQALVTEVLAAIAATRALVVAVRRRQPALADDLVALVRAHAAHGRELGDLPAPADRPVPARTAAAARAQVVTAEQGLQDLVADATAAARSGTLAAVLASVTASLAQHRMVLQAAS